MSIISVNNNLGIPKYKQIITSVENALVNGDLSRGDKLPSINSIKNRFSLSRDTVLIAYNDLKARGIIQSIPGKGYYVINENISVVQKIFLLFDELNGFKEDLYNSFLANLNSNIEVDIYFHHFNTDIFRKLIYDNIGNYNYYVIMPANLNNTQEIINKLPKEKVYILDQTHEELAEYSAIYQNFETDIISSLTSGLDLLKKYHSFLLLFNSQKQPQGMLKGFKSFCNNHQFSNSIVESLENHNPKKGEMYLIPDDRNLIILIKKLKETGLQIGADVGIISYNDTLMKEIVEGGITTISTDFKKMGQRLAEMILNNESVTIENPNTLIIRNSL